MRGLLSATALALLSTLPDESVDAVVTDPPYAAGATLADKALGTVSKYTATKKRCPFPDFEGDTMSQRAWTNAMADVLREARRCCTEGAPCVLFIDWRNLPSMTDALQRAGWIWRGVAVWDKLNARPQHGRFRQQAEFIVWGSKGRMPVNRPVSVLPGVYRASGQNLPDRIHQTQKPLELMRDIVRICEPGGVIVDPFAGSGTTLLAAREEGYRAIGAEISPVIARSAAKRLQIDLMTIPELIDMIG